MLERTYKDTRKCDCCNKIIDEPTFYRNDGSFQATFLTIGKNDLCMLCALEILCRFKNHLPENSVNDFIKQRREKLFPLEKVDLKIFDHIKDNIKWEK